MASTQKTKIVFLTLFAVISLIWVLAGAFAGPPGTIASTERGESDPLAMATPSPDQYVGSDTCSGCHDDQSNRFAKTKHAKLAGLDSWKGKVQGCESCHGPGLKHVEDPTVKGSIISFVNKNSKEISETCLSCHAGKETHNNFRRGEHWRNNIGCTECHSAHGGELPKFKLDSMTLIGPASRQRANQADLVMLKQSEPQLCIGCHAETKSQFSKPFRHKVLEGLMKCSDCHNPHGGFDQKQTKAAVGADQACVKCHSDKQGPFVFEHAPLKVEGCSACHTPHGSANPKMLKRSSVRQLCIECHTEIFAVEFGKEPSHGPHSQTSIRSQNCVICHVAIHGSNAQRNFFR